MSHFVSYFYSRHRLWVGDTGLKRFSDKEALIINQKKDIYILKVAFHVCYFSKVIKGHRFWNCSIDMKYVIDLVVVVIIVVIITDTTTTIGIFLNSVYKYLMVLPLHQTITKCVKMHFKYFIFYFLSGISFMNTPPLWLYLF